MFIEDETILTTQEEKNRALSEILRTIVRDKDIKIITRIDGGSHGWQFEFNN